MFGTLEESFLMGEGVGDQKNLEFTPGLCFVTFVDHKIYLLISLLFYNRVSKYMDWIKETMEQPPVESLGLYRNPTDGERSNVVAYQVGY